MAIEHHALTTSGKTQPQERTDGTVVEVVAKFSAGCEEHDASLAREVIAACLAVDLGFPVPEPFLVDVPRNWALHVTDPHQRARIKASSPVTAGSLFSSLLRSMHALPTSIRVRPAPRHPIGISIPPSL